MSGIARFDDFGAHDNRAFELSEPAGSATAESAGDVVAVLHEAEAAADRGLWSAGYVAYEAAPGFDATLAVRPGEDAAPPAALPPAHFMFFERYVDVAPFAPRTQRPAPYTVSAWTPSIERATYMASVGRIRRRIAVGDVHQVNHTFRLHAAFSGDPLQFYRDLVLAQRGSYGAYLDLERFHVLSASPERFFRLQGSRITTRPMKGTTPRGRWPAEDTAAAEALNASAKDRAENLMIVDLLRKDLGRVATIGTVAVKELLALERYETIWQLTSTVSADLRPDVGIADVFTALFPAGSATGAPKARSMSIIASLEDSPRGVYCGAVGFIAPEAAAWPRASFNVAIRTVTVDTREGVAEYGVGGAITLDSTEEGEYEEARAKARVLVERRPDFDLVATVRWEGFGGGWKGSGAWRWLDRHVDRMMASARYFGYQFDAALIRAHAEDAVAGTSGPCGVRLCLSRDGTVRAEVEILDGGMNLGPSDGPAQLVVVDDERVVPSDVGLYHMTSARRPYVDRRKRHPLADDVLMVNETGCVTEATTSNIVYRIDDTWYTPPIGDGCLPGVLRAVLVDEGRLIERTLPLDELAGIEEFALIDSVRGWRRALLTTRGGSLPPA